MRRHGKPTVKRRKIGPLTIKSYIPFKKGRPKRRNAIKRDDITNLKILLNNCRDFDYFIANL